MEQLIAISEMAKFFGITRQTLIYYDEIDLFKPVYVTNFRRSIISIFVLTLILALLISHLWLCAFLIMSVMALVVKSADIPHEDAVKAVRKTALSFG